MSGPSERLSKITSHLKHDKGSLSAKDLSQPPKPEELNSKHKESERVNYHTLSPTLFLPRAAAIEPEAEAIHHLAANGRLLRRTYAQVAERALGLAYYLRKHALQRVGILCPNTPAFLEAIYGIVAGNGVIVAINYRLNEEDISYIFQHAGVDAIIVDLESVVLLENFRRIKPDVKIIIDTDNGDFSESPKGAFDEAIAEGLELDRSNGNKGWSGLECQARDEEAVISLAYTSGTTAKPKGVEYTHRGCYLAALANASESGLNVFTGRCRYLWTLPMFHAMGWTFPWAVTAVRGTHYCLRKVDYPYIWHLLRTQSITHFNAAPTVNTLLCNAKEASRLPHPVQVTVAASPPSPHLFETMASLNLNPIHVYGLTETYGPITKCYRLPQWDSLTKDKKFRKLARQGHAFLTSLPVRVVHTDSSDNSRDLIDVARDGRQIGEIVLRGNICAKGYYNDEEATRRLFAGGFLHTGDLAVWHPDGAIEVLDRAKDIIISGGENISSVALESQLARHPRILEVGVVAVPDKRWGERPKAYVTAKNTLENDHHLCGDDVIEWAKGENSGISGFMIPREVEVVAELPKTATGKVKKKVLREWARREA